MKKRSNIALVIILLLLLSIPFAAYFHFKHLVNAAERNPANKGLKTIRMKANDKDSIEITFNGNETSGIKINTNIRKHN